ncbi:MAG: sialate O-acetylesterase [Gammaproteobacteria bacterium]|nr:sialate O-acetylesterase [Gammaproteobacteria bacterium]
MSDNFRLTSRLLLLLMPFLMAACSGSGTGNQGSELFSLAVPASVTLVEGDAAGIDVPVTLTRAGSFDGEVALTVSGTQNGDDANVTSVFSDTTLQSGVGSSTLNLRLSIDALPILPQTRQFTVTATGTGDLSTERASVVLNVDVTPVDAMDVYLLIGQSNMVGFSGDGTKQAGPGEPDEPNERIFQLNVSKNSESEIFIDAASYTDPAVIAVEPRLVIAEDPLHVPQDPDSRAKEENYIGLGLSFAKQALNYTSRTIVLVPAAWSGSAFCSSSLPSAYWNAQEQPDNPATGNTLLFDRAIARTNLALTESGGILRGILWHQGESDDVPENPACAQQYQQNLQLLAGELRARIQADRRGIDARRADANIPFVVGTMSRGIDERGDFSGLSAEKAIIDGVHRSVASLIPHAAVSLHDDLVPPAYPCGNTSCIHFGAEAFREMGVRYHSALREAANR